MLEVSQEGEHVQRIVEQLRLPPFDQHLQPVALIRALPAGADADASVAGLPMPVARVRATEEEHAGWASHIFTGGQWHCHDPLSDFPEAPLHLVHTWQPVAGVPTRQEVLEALQMLVHVPGVQALQAVLQTGRSGYDCRYVAGGETAEGSVHKATDPGAIESARANLSAALRLQETVWRLDNRVRLGLAQGTDLAGLQQALAALEALWS